MLVLAGKASAAITPGAPTLTPANCCGYYVLPHLLLLLCLLCFICRQLSFDGLLLLQQVF
jgi:hypothetical protein